MEEFRVRFAPSPTGYLHIGGVRTALFNYYAARHYDGKFILRIEDTDKTRSTEESINNMIESLKWLGIKWDEGPFFQSKRIDIYKKYIYKLLKEKKAYYCFCTKEELDAKRERMIAMKMPPVYDGACRNLSEEEIKEKFKINPHPTVRFKISKNEIIEFKDIVRGNLKFDTGLIGDFIILKSDGFPSYNFAVVVDDALMKISHIIRGEDHISNTPKQIMLYKALNFNMPQFAHTSLILDKNHSKLSKRDDSTSLLYLKDKGYIVEAIKNYIALLGWSPPDGNEFLNEEQLINLFSFDRLSKSSAIYDLTKLDWLNGKYLRKMDIKKLTELSKHFIIKSGLANNEYIDKNLEWFYIAIESIRDNIIKLTDVPIYLRIYFKDINPIEIDSDMIDAIKLFYNSINNREDLNLEFIRTIFKESVKLVKNKKEFYLKMREILTNQKEGPQLDYVVLVYGRDKTLNILKNVLEQKGEKNGNR